MVDPDRPPPPPTLNPKAKQYERQLHKIFAVDTASIWLTKEDWKGAKAQLEDLAKDVRSVRTELTAPTDGTKGWTGPAADAALASLKKLSDTLDGHAVKVGDVDSSLNGVYKAVWDAKNAWDEEVDSISTYVDPADHQRLPAPYAPTPSNVANYSVTDETAVAEAEDALWEKRNKAAKKILDDLGVQTQEATGKMPIDSKDSGEGPYTTPSGPGPGSNYPTNTTTPSGNGVYEVDPQGPRPPDTDGGPVDGGIDPVIFPEPVHPEPIVVIEGPGLTPGPVDPITLDGETTGSTGTTGPGTAAAASHAGGGGGAGGGVGAGTVAAGGVGAGAAGIGGLLGARGARGGGTGMVPGAGGQARGSGAGSRGSAGRPGGTGAAGTGRAGQVVPGGSSGRAGSASGAGRGGSSVKGASGAGRYGVPKLDGKGTGVVPASGQAARSGGRGATAARGGTAGGGSAAGRGGATGRGGAAMGAAGTRGSRKGDKDQAQDVDKLTREDEEAWFDGTEDSSPQVWE